MTQESMSEREHKRCYYFTVFIDLTSSDFSHLSNARVVIIHEVQLAITLTSRIPNNSLALC